MSKKYLAISFFVLAFAFVGFKVHASTDNTKAHVPTMMGTVVSVSGSTITFTTVGKNPTTYTVDSTGAKFIGGKDKSIASVQVGKRIVVQGTISGSTITASRVLTMPSPGDVSKLNFGPLRGVVTANDNGVLTITITEKTGHGKTATSTSKTVTVTPDAKARVSMSGVKGATISNVTVGSHVMIIGGTKDSSGNITGAKMISVMPAPKKM